MERHSGSQCLFVRKRDGSGMICHGIRMSKVRLFVTGQITLCKEGNRIGISDKYMQAPQCRGRDCFYGCGRNDFVRAACIHMQEILIDAGYTLQFLLCLRSKCCCNCIPANNLFSCNIRCFQFR